MIMKNKPETIENRWDILYRDYPEVYDKFASFPSKPKWIDVINKWFDLKGKTIVDIGSGSGLSTFSLAKKAKLVIGVEPENAMRKLAIKNARKKKIKNVKFVKGQAEKIPLKKNSVDMVVAVTVASFYKAKNIRMFVKESKRIVNRGGLIITVNVAPKWYGGELAPVILGKGRRTKVDTEGVVHMTLSKLNFKHKDFCSIRNYRTLKNVVETYGFIFGKKAIEYLKKHKKTKIKSKSRIHYRKV